MSNMITKIAGKKIDWPAENTFQSLVERSWLVESSIQKQSPRGDM